LVNSVTAAAEAAWLAEAQLNRASALLREVTSILRPLAAARGEAGGEVTQCFNICSISSEERARNKPKRHNWDVVSHDWDGMKQRLREVAVDVERGWKRITG